MSALPIVTWPLCDRSRSLLLGWVTHVVYCRYAKLETDVGEIDRARAIYVHGSSLANPGIDKSYWQAWTDFEIAHGNEDTFREMRRIMRSVNASFSETHFNTAIIDSAAQPITTGRDSLFFFAFFCPFLIVNYKPYLLSPQTKHCQHRISSYTLPAILYFLDNTFIKTLNYCQLRCSSASHCQATNFLKYGAVFKVHVILAAQILICNPLQCGTYASHDPLLSGSSADCPECIILADASAGRTWLEAL